MTEAGATVSVYAMHNAKGAGGATLLGTVTADANGAWSFATGAQSGTALHFTATATDVAGNVGASSATYNMTVIDTTSASLLGEHSVTNDGDSTSMGGTSLVHEPREWWSAIDDHHSDAPSGEGMSHGVYEADWQDRLWHDVGGSASAHPQLDRAETSAGDALPGANVGSPQKELFSLVTDVGWAGVGNPDVQMVYNEPGAFLQHDRMALFDMAHVSSGGMFLL
jgi:hypothetical protein